MSVAVRRLPDSVSGSAILLSRIDSFPRGEFPFQTKRNTLSSGGFERGRKLFSTFLLAVSLQPSAVSKAPQHESRGKGEMEPRMDTYALAPSPNYGIGGRRLCRFTDTSRSPLPLSLFGLFVTLRGRVLRRTNHAQVVLRVSLFAGITYRAWLMVHGSWLPSSERQLSVAILRFRLNVEEPDIHSRASSAVRPVTTKPHLFCPLYTLYMPLIFTPMYMYSFKGLFTSVPSVCFRYVSRNSRS